MCQRLDVKEAGRKLEKTPREVVSKALDLFDCHHAGAKSFCLQFSLRISESSERWARLRLWANRFVGCYRRDKIDL